MGAQRLLVRVNASSPDSTSRIPIFERKRQYAKCRRNLRRPPRQTLRPTPYIPHQPIQLRRQRFQPRRQVLLYIRRLECPRFTPVHVGVHVRVRIRVVVGIGGMRYGESDDVLALSSLPTTPMPPYADRQSGYVVRRVPRKGGEEGPKVETHVQDAQDRFRVGGRLVDEVSGARRRGCGWTYGGVEEAFT